MPDKASESSSSPCPRRGAPECGGAQMWRRRPRPVPSGPGGPKRPPCPGMPARGRVVTRCRRCGNRGFRAPPRDVAPHPAQPPSGRCGAGGGRWPGCRGHRPRVTEFQGPGDSPRTAARHTHLSCWGATPGPGPQHPFSGLPPVPLEAARAVRESGLWASSSVSVGRGR